MADNSTHHPYVRIRIINLQHHYINTNMSRWSGIL